MKEEETKPKKLLCPKAEEKKESMSSKILIWHLQAS